MKSDERKRARADHPVEELFARRWSPYAYAPRPVEREKLLSCLEAARWAASSYNEQPWRFLVSVREDEAGFARMLGCLVEANQAWARHAGALLITVVKRRFERNQKPNRVAEHDLGFAAAQLTLQGVALGLHVHHMQGVDLEAARATYAVPEGFDPWTAIAIGYAAEPERAAEPRFGERDLAPRPRLSIAEFAFSGRFGEPFASGD